MGIFTKINLLNHKILLTLDQEQNLGNEKNSIISENETPNPNNINDNIEEIKSNLENEKRK